MRILYVVHQFFPEYVGGTEQDTLDIAREMQRRGHTLAIFHRAPGPQALLYTEWEGIPLRRVQAGPMRPWALFCSAFGHRGLERAFRIVFREIDPDLVHFQHLAGLPASLVSWTRRMGRPVLISLRDFWFVCPNAQLLTNDTQEVCTSPGRWSRCARCALARVNAQGLRPLSPLFAPIIAARGRVLRQALGRANVRLAFSRFVQEWHTQHSKPMSFRCIERGIRRPERMPARSRTDRRIRFTYIGGLAWQKGVHILIEAFNSLGDSAELVIAGDETKFPDYVRHLRAICTHPGVRFIGRLDRDQVWQALVDSDVVVIPSLWFETYSMILHEAHAAGIPVITSAHGALAEAVRDGVDGLLVPPGDMKAWRAAMQRLVEEPGLLTHLRTNVRPPPTMEEYADQLESLYIELLKAVP